jgi:cytosine/adenosine deaminase-related metal-dependent hydrolase
MATLVRGGWILRPAGADLPRGDLLIEGDRIAAVAADLPVPPGAEVIDATGMIVMPGLVDTHRHTWQTVLRHRGSSWSLGDYLSHLLQGIGGRFSPEDVYAGTLLASLSALDAGITTLVDWAHIQNTPEHADASVRALTDARIRAVFAHGWAVGPEADYSLPHSPDLRRVRERLLPSDDGLVTLAMGARGPDFTSLETTAGDFALARELGIPITAHIATGRPGGHQQGVQRLYDAGLLGPDLTVVHGNGASDDALKQLADHGVTVSVSPQIELTMPGLGADVATRRLLSAGIRPGLSTDSETAASGDMFTQMRFALAVHRAGTPDDEPALAAREVLRLATADGARTAGLGHRTGSLEAGKAADVILIRAGDLNLAPVSAPAEAIVLAAHPGNVDTVLVAGEVVKRAGRLLADTGRARDLASASAARLFHPTG